MDGEAELLARAEKLGYTVVKHRDLWWVRDEAHSWEPAMRDREQLLRLLAERLVHVGSDPNAVP